MNTQAVFKWRKRYSEQGVLKGFMVRRDRGSLEKLDNKTVKKIMVIDVNKVIGLVGASGSGKSTAIDILLGLIQPEKGELLIDGKPITKQQLRAWQNALGFVPQSIFLADSSMRENIAFDLPPELIDEEKVERAATMAHPDEATSTLDGITEKLIMDAIHDFSGKKIIIMIAHRLATVKQCDNIFMMLQGKVVDFGIFNELSAHNLVFQRMANHS